MELKEIIRTRRTVHRFMETPVSKETVLDLLETAIWVPNHKMTEPWRFILIPNENVRYMIESAQKAVSQTIDDPERRQNLIEKIEKKLSSVPYIVLFVMNENPDALTREEDYASVSCLIHNFTLLAWEQGLGTVWETYGFIRNELFKEALGISKHEKIVGSVHIGHPKVVPSPQPRTSLETLITEF